MKHNKLEKHLQHYTMFRFPTGTLQLVYTIITHNMLSMHHFIQVEHCLPDLSFMGGRGLRGRILNMLVFYSCILFLFTCTDSRKTGWVT